MTAAPSKVLVEANGPVTTIVINRPEQRNAVDGETAILLRQAFVDFEADDTALVAVLTGQGTSFCAGYDLKYLASNGLIDDPAGEGPMGPSRLHFKKPVIAAIEGFAVAGGLELALMCDLRVASGTAVFGVFCRRWGVPLIDGGTVRLPRVVGQGRALDMILTGRPVNAHEAMDFGLANRLVAPGEARREAEGLAHEIARFPQVCLRSDRESAFTQWGLSPADALKHEAELGAAARIIADDGAGRFAAGKGRSGDFSNL